MKKWRVLLFMMPLFVLAACSKEETALPKPIEVNLEVPQTAALNEQVTILTTVTQNGKPVEDADEVKFEIWKNGAKEESEMMEAELGKSGVYKIEKSFAEEAVYHVQVHVTARGLHTMPKSAIVIGQAAVPADTNTAQPETDHPAKH